MGMANWAQGSLTMVGMYIAYWFFVWFGIDPFVSAALCAGILFVIGLAIEKVVIVRVLAEPSSQTSVTIGLMVFLTNFALVFWGSDFRVIDVWYAEVSINALGIFISLPRLIACTFAIAAGIVLYLFIEKTETGLALRAVSQERKAAELMGVNVSRIYLICWGLGAACAGIAGALIGMFFYIQPGVGSTFMLAAFISVVLGGLGSYVGVILGGLTFGVVEALGGFLVDPGLKQVFGFIVFILVLLVRPKGLFGK
jgi:branched-chain amino acid transport system permease protein